jgi:hypothetical protein
MTKKEALISLINFALPDSRIEKALIDADLNGTEIYAKTDERNIDFCFAGLLFTLMTTADVAEDDVSLKLPQRDQLLKIFSSIYNKWGVPDPLATVVVKPTVKQVKFW